MLSRLASRVAVPASRSFRTSAAATDKVVMVLYPDPTTGYPPKYARDDIPVIDVYADGQTAPTPKGRDFVPGELLGSVSGMFLFFCFLIIIFVFFCRGRVQVQGPL